jgi:hypothetical protein
VLANLRLPRTGVPHALHQLAQARALPGRHVVASVAEIMECRSGRPTALRALVQVRRKVDRRNLPPPAAAARADEDQAVVSGCAKHSTVRTTGARRRADRPVEDRRARPAIPRSMSFCDTCVAPRYSNGPASGRRNTGAEAFEFEGMDPCYIDIDGFWPKDADTKSPESAPIAN